MYHLTILTEENLDIKLVLLKMLFLSFAIFSYIIFEQKAEELQFFYEDH